MTTTTKTKPATLAAALVAAQAAAHAVEKDSTNQFHRYRYVSAEAMIADSKEMLAANHLGLVPRGFILVDAPGIRATVTGKNGPQEFSCAGLLRARWDVVHGPSGETLEISADWPVVPEAGRPLDKAVAAARTASLSYLLRDLLQLPRVEDGTGLDNDRRDSQQQDPRPKPAPQKAPAKVDSNGPTDAQARDIKAALVELGITADRGAYIDAILPDAETVEQFSRVLDVLRSRVGAKKLTSAADEAEMRGGR
jgi:hypothetical protein